MAISKRKLNIDRDGNTIAPILKGHLVIPTTERKYKVIDTITIELTKEDISVINKMIKYFKNKTFKNKTIDDTIVKQIVTNTIIMDIFPNAIYEQIKNELPDYFNRCDMFRINMIDFFDEKHNKILIHLDCLEELKHVEVK